MTDKKRILIVMGRFAIGGGENMVYELIKQLDRSKYEIMVLCTGCPIHNSLEQSVIGLVPISYLNFTGKLTVHKVLRFFRTVQKLNPDLIHSHLGGNAYTLPWATITNARLIVTAHTTPEKAFSRLSEKFVRILLKRKNFTLVAVSSENQKKMLKYFATSTEKCKVINNGIDLSRFYHIKHKGFNFINVARQDENKNQASIVRAFAKIHKCNPETGLILLGDGPEHEKLKALVSELGIDDCVYIPGNISDTEKFYATSDCYVQSSHREAMPLSVLEAMASGLPIVTTDVGGLKDVVSDNGYLVENNENRLLDAMDAILRLKPAERAAMQESSLRIVEEYSSTTMADQYTELYEDATNN